MPTLLIADRSEDLCAMLCRTFSADFQITTCQSGALALELLQKSVPDALVLGLSLPELDGLTLLREISPNLPKAIVVLADLPDPYIYQSLSILGVHYILLKPCRPLAIYSNLMALMKFDASENENTDPTAIVSAYLTALGFREKHYGTRYLRKVVPLYAQDTEQRLSKEIFTVVGDAYGVDYRSVEHCVRTAIEAAWKNGDPKVWQRYYPGCTESPTNKDFIARLATFREPPEK